LTKEEGLGKKPLHSLKKTRLGVTKMVVIALVAIIIVSVIVTTYIALQLPSSSPTPSSTPYMHTVNWKTMANYTKDLWNITVMNPYTVILNDSMTVSSGDQYLQVWAQNSTDLNTQWYIWEVVFMNSTYFQYKIDNLGGAHYMQGYLYCNSGIVQVVSTQTTLTITGTSLVTTNMAFQNLEQIQTSNGDGNFNSGELRIDAH
jgi:hypothetical protein